MEFVKSQQAILIIDDDSDYQWNLQKSLKREGYDCMNCANVEEALEQIKTKVPDLILLDLGFRQASGFAFLQNISQVIGDNQKVPPVIVVSGYCDREIVEVATTLGASRFLPKPSSSAQIVSAIRSCLH